MDALSAKYWVPRQIFCIAQAMHWDQMVERNSKMFPGKWNVLSKEFGLAGASKFTTEKDFGQVLLGRNVGKMN